MTNESRKASSESRIQIPNAPDMVMKMVLMENLGTHLKAALRGRIEIDNASVVAINSGKKSSRVSTILTLIAAELEEYMTRQLTEPSGRSVAATTAPNAAPASTVNQGGNPEKNTSVPPPKIDKSHFS